MKVLVATSELQGDRDSDFFWCKEGELIRWSIECDGNEDPDGGCGCQRSFEGIESLRSTTTVKVVDLDIDSEEHTKLLFASYRESFPSWNVGLEEVEAEAKEIAGVAGRFPVGAVLEKRGHVVQHRKPGGK